jgi:hypothetical protein
VEALHCALQTFALENLGLTVTFCGLKTIAPLWFYTHTCNIHKQLDLKWSVKDVLNNLSLVRQVASRELVATQSKQNADFFELVRRCRDCGYEGKRSGLCSLPDIKCSLPLIADSS